jgi:hypothetical protein
VAGEARGKPQEEMMRFKSRDLMMDVLPTAKRYNPGLILCGQATAGGRETGGGDDEEGQECGQATATGGEPGFTPAEAGLALLRQQLQQARQLHQSQSARV